MLTVPGEAEVQEITVSGRRGRAKPDQGRLRITVPAGAQTVAVRWREPHGMRFYQRAPTVGLPVPAVNVETILRLPENRWLLFHARSGLGTGRPLLGLPGLRAGGGLRGRCLHGHAARDRRLAAARPGPHPDLRAGRPIVTGLFLVLAWRARHTASSPLAHNAIQVVLVVWIVIAMAVLLRRRSSRGCCSGRTCRSRARRATTASCAGTRTASRTRRRRRPSSAFTLWVYRTLMLGWALWLAASLVRWSGWSWRALNEGGLWRPLPRRPPETRRPSAAPGRRAGVSRPSGTPGREEELPDDDEDRQRPDAEKDQNCGRELSQTPNGVIHQLEADALDVPIERLSLLGQGLAESADGGDPLGGDLLQGRHAFLLEEPDRPRQLFADGVDRGLPLGSDDRGSALGDGHRPLEARARRSKAAATLSIGLHGTLGEGRTSGQPQVAAEQLAPPTGPAGRS